MIAALPGLLFACLLSVISGNTKGTSSSPEMVFRDYLAALKAQKWSLARTFWHPDLLDASRRLEITYEGIPAKFECASRLGGTLDLIRQGEVQLEVRQVTSHGDWAELLLEFSGGNDSAEVIRYLVVHQGEWRLATLPFILTRNWPSWTTRYLHIYCADSTRINSYALQGADNFVEGLARRLHLPPSSMTRLAKEKILYYLCEDSTIQQVIGVGAQGMTDLGFDAIISRHLPHQHEITHLLLNYAAKKLPLFTLPCLQEGAAVCLGGRGGKSPEVIFMLGCFALAEGLVELDDILTFNGFHISTGVPDLSYAASGVFCNFLIEKYGIKRFQLLYRQLSGTGEKIHQLTAAEIQATISQVCEVSWPVIEEDFAVYWPQFEFSGIYPGLTVRTENPLFIIASRNLSLTVRADDDRYFYEIQSSTTRPDGVILLGVTPASVGNAYRSRIYCQHLPQAEYSGERYGIRFTPEEVGLYNYYTNTLVAKYVLSFSPDSTYFNPREQILRFALDKRLLDKKLEDCHVRLTDH